MIEIGSREWVDLHFTVGTIGDEYNHLQAIACRHCGSFVWDMITHMEALHLDEMDVRDE